MHPRLRTDIIAGPQLLSRRPPFGHEVLSFVNQLPQYWVKIEEASKPVPDSKGPIEIELSIKCGLSEDCSGKSKPKGKNKFRDATLILTTTSDLDFVDFRKISYVQCWYALSSPSSPRM